MYPRFFCKFPAPSAASAGRRRRQEGFARPGWLLPALFAGLALLFAPEAGALEYRSPYSDRRIDLERFNADLWDRLGTADRKSLAPHLMEAGASSFDSDVQKEMIARFARERDPFLQAHANIAAVYFRRNRPRERAVALQRLRDGWRGQNAPAATIADFYYNVERKTAGDALPAKEFLGVCDFPEQESSCRLAKLRAAIEAAEQNGGDAATIRSALQSARPLLARNPVRPPFYWSVGADLPERLFALGLPLEAAILAERMTHGRSGESGAAQFQRRIPFYLAGAGDFSSAARFSAKIEPQADALDWNARLDWLILAGRYRDALEYISRVTPERLASGGMQGRTDYWTGFPVTEEGVRLRGAMLLYLAGDVKAAAEALERLKDMPGKGFGDEPASLYARLRVAQILLRENPELAHKIAEDISYIAQENGWLALEYHSTILDGWAQLYRGESFRSTINFIKARGILTAELKPRHETEYSRLLGLLAARNSISPRGDHSGLIREINELLSQTPYNPAVYSIRRYSPAPDAVSLFLEEALKNFLSRGRTWDALNLLLEYRRVNERFFDPGENPGGARGRLTSMLWSRELGEFAYAAQAPGGALQIHGKALQTVRAGLPKVDERNLSPRDFDNRNYYLFHFPLNEGRYVFFVFPGRGGAGLAAHFLDAEAAGQIQNGCGFYENEGCAELARHFGAIRSRAGASDQRELFVQYDPAFDPDWGALLFSPKDAPASVHFYRPETIAGTSSVQNARQFRPEGCRLPVVAPDAQRVAAFDELFTAEDLAPQGVWIWPADTDNRLSSAGRPRPPYLRKFECGPARLRMWDLDRFFASGGLEMIVYRRRAQDAELDRVFARHFADHGAALLEADGGAGDASAAALLKRLDDGGDVLRAYLQGSRNNLRLILPGIPK